MKKRNMTPALSVSTLLDSADRRHIIPAMDAPALCGATGTQEKPREHRINTLCLRCRQKYARQIAAERMTRFGI